ncbi:hypothetical protein N7510_005436 [Penicillium lagena]|uniref:uncharacterized protein n=1 Tax=Penicillium lagena TaxID=94218 RepID=UPI00254207B9|nr:uncharacterized protein N7510_005436 [Penicillium lagena]KAJ5612242.1 hypothetical protein N7510_005436 [Penicillium lagena]
MFYSHEILTSPEHGVATIWQVPESLSPHRPYSREKLTMPCKHRLVATLGSRSITRRVNRKAILDVNVPQACRVIINPEAPMALRLQGSLLYGVSRVYNQQCGFTLLEVQGMHDRMESLVRSIPGSGLDPSAGKAKPGQLIVPHDPAFLPETGLPGLDIDFSVFDKMVEESFSQKSTGWLSKSPMASQMLSSETESIQIELASDDVLRDIGMMSVQSDINSPIQKRSVGGKMHGSHVGDEEQGILLQPDFEFDEDGNIVELSPSRLSPRRSRSIFELEENVRTEAGHEDGHKLQSENKIEGIEKEADWMELDNQNPIENNGQLEAQETRARQARRETKHIAADNNTTIRNADLARWNEQYGFNMARAWKQKQLNKIPTLAKKNAAFWVFGKGIGSVGVGLGVSHESHPLKCYSGDELYDIVCVAFRQNGRKRAHSPDGDELGSMPRRMCVHDDSRPDTEQSMRDVETGRQGPGSLDDDHSSQMPWNITASVQSSQRGRGLGSELSSRGYGESRTSRPRSRLMSASPLAGRSYLDGRELLSNLSPPGYEVDDLDITQYLESELAADRESLSMISARHQSEVLRVQSTLDRESLNFLDFIKSKVESQVGPNWRGSGEKPSQIAFSTILPPVKTSRAVATQGLMNALTLATKGALALSQDPYDDESSASIGTRYRYGEIYLRLAGFRVEAWCYTGWRDG